MDKHLTIGDTITRPDRGISVQVRTDEQRRIAAILLESGKWEIVSK